ncbi:hypothetical protein ACQ4M3_07535 [Leptolyngbya sp. AN03gr2]|uniref:hypothetical protein n=1 Tax=unclassified Leptolyngbya TaxID=2650499 RepID=UPI003D31375D
MTHSCVRKNSRSARAQSRLKWSRVSDFSGVVTVVAQTLRLGQFRQTELHRFLEAQRVHLPWERCDAQIQETLISFDDELQFEIQRILYEELSRAYEHHYPDCGGSRGVMLMLALMKCLTSLELALGIDVPDQRAAAPVDPFWYG